MTAEEREAFVAEIQERESGEEGLNAFLSLVEADAAAEKEPRQDGPLSGVPVAVKDNIATLRLPTTCGSKILEGYQSPFEATAARKLREAGAWIVGKTNLDEFGMGSSTENSAFGPTCNPRDRSRVPGGSSGGSAAAVAAGYVSMALGSDTGGSVRQPAALCGVVGIKPTYGRVSRYGLVAFASSLDQVGTLGRDVGAAAKLLEAICGHDSRDATSARRPAPHLTQALGLAPEGLVVGLPEEYLPDDLDPAVRASIELAVDALEQIGCTIRRVSLPHTGLAIPCYYLLAPSEASSNLARYDGVRFGLRKQAGDVLGMNQRTRATGLGMEVKRRIMLGTYALSAGYHDEYYGKAQRARDLIRADFTKVFADGVDVLFTPTTPGPAFRIGERIDDPVSMYLSDVFTVTANLAGLPAMSVPIGPGDALPLGGQLIAPWWEEERMVSLGAAIERAMGLST